MHKLIAHVALLMLLLGGTACAGTVIYIYTDAQGTPLAEADADGNIIAQFDYTPYGAPVPIMGPAPDGPGYTGHVNDPGTGLVYMQARYYDPAVGRFLSVDPVGPKPGNTFNFNRYNYANNNPYKFVDPDGREAGFTYNRDGSMHHFYMDHAPDPALAEAAIDFTPIVGDIKATVEAIANPTAVNITVAGVGLVPVIGDVAAKAVKGADKLVDASKAAGNARGTIFVDSKGNAIVTPTGGKIEGSPDGRFIQAKDANGQATGVRIDGGHNPSTHPDPRAQQPHGHVPSVTNADGTPWLPLKDMN